MSAIIHVALVILTITPCVRTDQQHRNHRGPFFDGDTLGTRRTRYPFESRTCPVYDDLIPHSCHDRGIAGLSGGFLHNPL